jgi:predicted CXXCH cytochrome family protein
LNNNSHVKRIFALLIIAGIMGFGVRALLVPDTFGTLGHYRAESLKDILKLKRIYQGKEACAPCHENYDILKKDVHYDAQCENCHGAGDIHIAKIGLFLKQNNLKQTESGKYTEEALKTVSKEMAKMPKEYTLEGCLYCHRKLESRPHDFAQIDPKEHYKFLHVTDDSIRCVECHNPHQPLFLLNPVSEAKIHPALYECEYCHRKRPEKGYKEVKNHPVIFECEDCHAAIVQDFKKREHAFMQCTGCHLYHRENETSGRIFKNGNKQFCLLCHEKKPYKDQKSLPQIDVAKHLEDMPEAMRKDAKTIMNSKTACLECHYNFIHNPDLIKVLREQKQWAKKITL